MADDSWSNDADAFGILMRMAFPKDPAELKTYIANAKENNKIFRVNVPLD
jgi:hypothetical protein